MTFPYSIGTTQPDGETDMDEKALRDEYAPRVREVTLEELPSFISELMDREHDYGSICVAIGIAAAATAWACNKHKNGGVTGFQAGAVFWEFVRAWGSPSIGECGARIVNYDDLLFPQYADKFTSISADTLEAVRKAAEKNLAERDGPLSEAVIAHWQSIVDGHPPFGLNVAA